MYKIIYADPPWRFAVRSDKGLGKSADQHYPTMTIDKIKQIPVSKWAAQDCALFLWVTDPCLQQAFEVIDAWGFIYKTVAFTWVKTSIDGSKYPIGTGYWTRANPEMCLLATKGSPKRLDRGVRQLVIAPRREHSRKPDIIRDDIVRLMGDVPRLEMFARTSTPGWAVWGNQVNLF